MCEERRIFRRVRKFAKSDYQLRRVRLSVRPPARKEQLGSHWTDFDETWYSSFFENLSRKFKFIKIREE